VSLLHAQSVLVLSSSVQCVHVMYANEAPLAPPVLGRAYVHEA